MPLAISFFTFQQIGFLVDCYYSKIKKVNFHTYSIFVLFFPQLIAGPIIRFSEVNKQYIDKFRKKINYINVSKGLLFFFIGLFKKVIIADTLSEWVNDGFNNSENLNFIEAWVTSISYSLQLYFDFSGYVDMAIGIALLFNISLPLNFNSPYKSKNIRVFWQNWHITLGRFLRDYLYIPLGGNKISNKITMRNIIITFFLGGLWHGAAWTFIFWGLLHGFALITLKIWEKFNIKINKYISILLTLIFVNFSWVFFRASSWQEAINVIEGMIGFNGIILPKFLENYFSFLSFLGIRFGGTFVNIQGDIILLLCLIVALIIVFAFKNSYQIVMNFTFKIRDAIILGIIYLLLILSINKNSEFLYFDF